MNLKKIVLMLMAAGALTAGGCRASFRDMDEDTKKFLDSNYIKQAISCSAEDFSAKLMGDNPNPLGPYPTDWSVYSKELGADYQKAVDTESIMQSAEYANDGIKMLTNDIMATLDTFVSDNEFRITKEMGEKLSEYSPGKDLEGLYAEFRLNNKDKIDRTRGELTGLSLKLNNFDYNTLSRLREIAWSTDNQEFSEKLLNLTDAYESRLSEIQNYLKANIWVLASEGVYSGIGRAVELDDKIENALTGTGYIEAGKKVFEKNKELADAFEEQMKDITSHFESRDQHYADDIMNDSRDPIAKELFNLYKENKIDFKQFVGALYYVDSKISEVSGKWPEVNETFFGYLARWIPPVALADIVRNQNPSYLFAGDDNVSGRGIPEILKECAAGYSGATNYPNHVGTNHAWSELGYNAFILGTEAALFNALYGAEAGKALGGGGRDPRTGGPGVKGGK